ncbi:Glucanosyltransferase-domain-containing protein [Chlamydoabsidia padenii]|nr:Glucanosyltransferase-domain-containing protein [Chlamydoabsidia padenii]
MRPSSGYLGLVCILWINASTITALNPIIIKGQKFFDSVTKDQFFIKGVAYQPREGSQTIQDPLANPEACARDIPLIKELGANAIRVYEIDPHQNHDTCMSMLAEYGLYLILDISTRASSIHRDHPTYDVPLYNVYRSIVSSFINYPHVLAFIAGNEVTNDNTNTQAAAYVKAVIRDMKMLMRLNKTRAIPVGYASNDDIFIRDSIKDFFVCGDDDDNQADFFGVNLYEWCGESSFEGSGYADRTREFEAYGKPVFLSEYGCNLVRPRPFDEVDAIYGPQMTPVWSGGVAYEWTQEENDYGLVKIVDGQVQPMKDYDNLQKYLTMVEPVGVKMDDYISQHIKTTCPPYTVNWRASTVLPPTPSEGACQCMKENLSCISSDAVVLSANNVTVGSQIDAMCGLINCSEIRGDGEEKEGIENFGIFSFCSPMDKLSRLYHLYVQNNTDLCDFNGYALPVSPLRNNITVCSSIKPDTSGLSYDPFSNRSNIIRPTFSLFFILTLFIVGI